MEIEDILEKDLIDIFSNNNCSLNDNVVSREVFKTDEILHTKKLQTMEESNVPEVLHLNVGGAISNADELLKLMNGLLANKSIEITIKLKDN